MNRILCWRLHAQARSWKKKLIGCGKDREIDVGANYWASAYMLRNINLIILVFFFACFMNSWAALAQATITWNTVPFIGCKVDGQDSTALSGPPVEVSIPAAVASKLAVYTNIAGLAVLAPRGWLCSSTQGTAGGGLWVYPKGADYRTNGPVASEQTWGGDGPGNTYVMSYGGRYFPSIINESEVKDFISESGESEAQFLAHTYNTDSIIYKNRFVLQFSTPAGKPGLGSEIFGRSELSDYGFVKISYPPSNEFGIIFVGLRFSAEDNYLLPYILSFTQDCLVHGADQYCTIGASDE